MVPLKNIKKHLHEVIEEEVIHKASKIKFTAKTFPPKAYALLEEVENLNPFDVRYPTKESKIKARGVIYLAHGIKEFNGDQEKAEMFFNKVSFASSNMELIAKVEELNPHKEERVKNHIAAIALNQEEAKLLSFYLEHNLIPDLCKYLSDESGVIEAMAFCKEFLEAVEWIEKLKVKGETTFLNAALMLLREIMKEKGYDVPDGLSPEEKLTEEDIKEIKRREEEEGVRGLTLEEAQKYMNKKR